MNDGKMPLSRMTGGIYRSTQAYTNEILAKYELGSGTYPFLLTLGVKEGINQNQISRELDINKAMSARAIKRLIGLGYITKEEDREDSRAFKLYLTEKAKVILPVLREELRKWNDIITRNLSEREKETVIDLLSIVLKDTKSYRKKMKDED